MDCNDFIRVIEAQVLPLRQRHPDWKRLDGQVTGGNRDKFAVFEYAGSYWGIHQDTHFSPLLAAYDDARRGVAPFKISPTPKGRRLDLANPVTTRPRHLYIYQQ